MKHNDSLEKNKYGMLARRHDAINTNKFQSFANTIICIFGRKQFVVQPAWDDDEPHDIPAPLLYNCKQQNCVDWFIWSQAAYYIPSGRLLVIAAFYSCSRCSDHAPITSSDVDPDHWPGMMGTNNEMDGIVSSFLPLIQFSHNVILSYRYHYCCLINLKLMVCSKFGFWSSRGEWQDVALTNVQWAQ